MDFSWLTEALKTNEFMQGGLVVAAFTSILLYLKQVPQRLFNLFIYYTSTELSFEQGDSNFTEALSYLISEHAESRFGSFYMINGKRVPSGMRWKFQNWSLVTLWLSKRDLEMKDYSNQSVAYSVDIKVFGPFRNAAIESLYKRFKKKDKIQLKIESSSGPNFDLPPRTFESIASPVTSVVKKDLDEFKESKEWYKTRGIPYRRGLLLHGPAGTGKSSLAIAIANYLRKNLILINFRTTSSHDLAATLAQDNRVFLIEDVDISIDTVKNRKRPNKEGNAFSLSLSEILNAIDGVTSGTGNILIMTTNDIGSLDPALIRPGRIDLCLEMGYMDQVSFDYLCQLYYPGSESFTVPEKITAAQVQQEHLLNKSDFAAFKESLSRERSHISSPILG